MSSFGKLFRVHTYGESHCAAVGCIVDGCPPGLKLSTSDIQPQLSRRRPGQSALTTPRDEKDMVKILSGVEQGYTLGTPIALQVMNEDHRPKDYSETDMYPRPSHADHTYLVKYGIKASSGGGRSSARETIGRVAAGAIAETYLERVYGTDIVAFVSGVGKVRLDYFDQADDTTHTTLQQSTKEMFSLLHSVTRAQVDADAIRCPVPDMAEKMRSEILEAKEAHDSVGGTVTCVIRNVPVGLGEPCFDKLEAMLAHAMLSIPATKSFEIGSGLTGCSLHGSAHNDPFLARPDGSLGTSSNFSGGIQGGITNGEHIYFRVGFKPPATIAQEQPTATYEGVDGILKARGRHDPCVVPRAVPIVESMAALVLMDALMLQESRAAVAKRLPSFMDQVPPGMTGKVPHFEAH